MRQYKIDRITKQFPELERFARGVDRKLLEGASVTVQVADERLKLARASSYSVPDASNLFSTEGGQRFFIAFYERGIKTLRTAFLRTNDCAWMETVGERFFAPGKPAPKCIVEVTSSYETWGESTLSIVIHKVRAA